MHSYKALTFFSLLEGPNGFTALITSEQSLSMVAVSLGYGPKTHTPTHTSTRSNNGQREAKKHVVIKKPVKPTPTTPRWEILRILDCIRLYKDSFFLFSCRVFFLVNTLWHAVFLLLWPRSTSNRHEAAMLLNLHPASEWYRREARLLLPF